MLRKSGLAHTLIDADIVFLSHAIRVICCLSSVCRHDRRYCFKTAQRVVSFKKNTAHRLVSFKLKSAQHVVSFQRRDKQRKPRCFSLQPN